MQITEVKSTEYQLSTKGFGEIAEGIDDINQCINVILYTKKGSDMLRPEFGCGVFDYIDKPIDKVRQFIITAVIEALQLFEPRINVVKVVPSVLNGELNVNVQWAFKNTVNTEQININYGT